MKLDNAPDPRYFLNAFFSDVDQRSRLAGLGGLAWGRIQVQAEAVVIDGHLAAVVLTVDRHPLVATADHRLVGRVGVGQGHEALGPGQRLRVAANVDG